MRKNCFFSIKLWFLFIFKLNMNELFIFYISSFLHSSHVMSLSHVPPFTFHPRIKCYFSKYFLSSVYSCAISEDLRAASTWKISHSDNMKVHLKFCWFIEVFLVTWDEMWFFLCGEGKIYSFVKLSQLWICWNDLGGKSQK